MDSVVAFCNPDSTILKSNTYLTYSDSPYVEVDYLRKNKQDSISKDYRGDELLSVYETKFDSLDRIIYRSLKQDSGMRVVFEEIYAYQDSTCSSGRVLIQTEYDGKQERKFKSKESSYYDERNREIKKVREFPGEAIHQVTLFVYDKKGELIEERWIWGDYETIIPMNEKSKNTKCIKELTMQLNATDIIDITTLAKRMVIKNKKFLIGEACENFAYMYTSRDNLREITVSKGQPYWEAGMMVTYRIKVIP